MSSRRPSRNPAAKAASRRSTYKVAKEVPQKAAEMRQEEKRRKMLMLALGGGVVLFIVLVLLCFYFQQDSFDPSLGDQCCQATDNENFVPWEMDRSLSVSGSDFQKIIQKIEAVPKKATGVSMGFHALIMDKSWVFWTAFVLDRHFGRIAKANFSKTKPLQDVLVKKLIQGLPKKLLPTCRDLASNQISEDLKCVSKFEPDPDTMTEQKWIAFIRITLMRCTLSFSEKVVKCEDTGNQRMVRNKKAMCATTKCTLLRSRVTAMYTALIRGEGYRLPPEIEVGNGTAMSKVGSKKKRSSKKKGGSGWFW